MILSKRAQNLKPSPTLALAALARDLKSQGHDVISLSVGEPDWNTYAAVVESGIDAIRKGMTKYVPASGIPELRAAVAKMTTDETGVPYTADQVTISTGGKFVIFSAFQSLINPGDEVLIPAPYWVSYPDMVQLADGVPVTVPSTAETNFKITAASLEKAITKKTKMLLINSPSNPTGETYSPTELLELANVLKKHPHVLILSDDIYNKLVFDQDEVAPHILNVAPELASRTIIINGASKSYSMTGWRVGWALGPLDVIKAMTSYQSQSVSCTPGFCQKAALTAIKESATELRESNEILVDRRDTAVELINKIRGLKVKAPGGAFYLWVDVNSYLGKRFNGAAVSNSKDFCKYLLEDQKVAVVPGAEFGQEGYMRISYAIDKPRMAEAIGRIQTFVQKID